MHNSKIIKMDSKGRILIPSQIRDLLNVDVGNEIVLIPDNENAQLKILPLIEGKTARLKILLSDTPGSLANVAKTLADSNINILTSESKSINKSNIAEWDVIVEVTDSLNNIEEILLNSGHIKNIEVIRK